MVAEPRGDQPGCLTGGVSDHVEGEAAGVQQPLAVVRVARRVLGELRRMEAELDALGAVEGGSVAVGVLPVAAVGILAIGTFNHLLLVRTLGPVRREEQSRA